eukprot:CAMPEP_0113284014 /NCGR_PEP_ID=MMETSP0008_2-20120614/29775_1 /TAXON_ID=97485 /ORGANISM="Prymnesium parvum" /LENGTH=63 /DNA_ID=CAMNT_0000134803 /DNA_START=21 /DNA_END=209 /DNA_ORIENTATION=- /assembly_acc=CAM_ASM_000153
MNAALRFRWVGVGVGGEGGGGGMRVFCCKPSVRGGDLKAEVGCRTAFFAARSDACEHLSGLRT